MQHDIVRSFYLRSFLNKIPIVGALVTGMLPGLALKVSSPGAEWLLRWWTAGLALAALSPVADAWPSPSVPYCRSSSSLSQLSLPL